MSSQTMTADAYFDGESRTNFRSWVIFAGITSLVLGIAAVIYANTATTVSVVLFGALLLIAGAMQLVHAFQVRTWSGFFLYLLDGIIRTTVGALLMVYPT